MKKFIIIFLLLFAPFANATEIYTVPPEPPNIFSRIISNVLKCGWHISCYSEQEFGTTITTINASDTLSASRTVINTNFSNLNAGKIEVSTTTLPLLTTIGTIGTGIWRGTGIEVGYGGTGTTSPTSNLVILGNGSAGFKTVNGFGTSGQFLTSTGAASAPTWQTSAIDTAIDYAWTGTHNFSITTATTTIARLTVGAIGGASAGSTGTTTIYDNVQITGNLKYNGLNFGAIRTCMGQIAWTTGAGYKEDSVSCGFQPSVVILTARAASGTVKYISHGLSNSTTNEVIAIDSAGNSTSSVIYSIVLWDLQGSSGSGAQGSTTITTLGFKITHTSLGNEAIINYLAY